MRDYGADNFFFLENNNTDSSQRNVVFIARGESAHHAHTIAGTNTSHDMADERYRSWAFVEVLTTS